MRLTARRSHLSSGSYVWCSHHTPFPYRQGGTVGEEPVLHVGKKVLRMVKARQKTLGS